MFYAVGDLITSSALPYFVVPCGVGWWASWECHAQRRNNSTWSGNRWWSSFDRRQARRGRGWWRAGSWRNACILCSAFSVPDSYWLAQSQTFGWRMVWLCMPCRSKLTRPPLRKCNRRGKTAGVAKGQKIGKSKKGDFWFGTYDILWCHSTLFLSEDCSCVAGAVVVLRWKTIQNAGRLWRMLSRFWLRLSPGGWLCFGSYRWRNITRFSQLWDSPKSE